MNKKINDIVINKVSHFIQEKNRTQIYLIDN